MSNQNISKTNYAILLPPSEGKISGGIQEIYSNIKHSNSYQDIQILRDEISKNLKFEIENSNEIEQEKILELKANKLLQAIETTLNFENEKTLPAIQRYDGVMFKAINYNEMNQTQKENFNNSVLFIDGMFGLLIPTDLIPDYKLKIGSKFSAYNITKFWKENLKQTFPEIFEKKELIIDILPQAHRKVVNFENSNHIQIMFAKIDEKSGKLKNVGHESKKLKGEIINFIVNHQNISRNDLQNWEHSTGFKYSNEFSTNDLIVYMR